MDNIVRFLHGARQVRGEKYNQERRKHWGTDIECSDIIAWIGRKSAV